MRAPPGGSALDDSPGAPGALPVNRPTSEPPPRPMLRGKRRGALEDFDHACEERVAPAALVPPARVHGIRPRYSIISGSVRRWCAVAITPSVIPVKRPERPDVRLVRHAQSADREHPILAHGLDLGERDAMPVTSVLQLRDPAPDAIMPPVAPADSAEPQGVEVNLVRQREQHPVEIPGVERIHPRGHEPLGCPRHPASNSQPIEL